MSDKYNYITWRCFNTIWMEFEIHFKFYYKIDQFSRKLKINTHKLNNVLVHNTFLRVSEL